MIEIYTLLYILVGLMEGTVFGGSSFSFGQFPTLVRVDLMPKSHPNLPCLSP
jgi:hypothetical protein